MILVFPEIGWESCYPELKRANDIDSPDSIVSDLREYFAMIIAEREELRAPKLNE